MQLRDSKVKAMFYKMCFFFGSKIAHIYFVQTKILSISSYRIEAYTILLRPRCSLPSLKEFANQRKAFADCCPGYARCTGDIADRLLSCSWADCAFDLFTGSMTDSNRDTSIYTILDRKDNCFISNI